jgi:molybdate/tungstate transport system permease protein
MKRSDTFFYFMAGTGVVTLLLIIVPLIQLLLAPSGKSLVAAALDGEVTGAIWLSIKTSVLASMACAFLGLPLSYILARFSFPGRNAVEAILDLPIMIPHPVVGIALLSIISEHHPVGKIFAAIGLKLIGTQWGIVLVLTFVGLPFFIRSTREGFEGIPQRLEKVSRSLGASPLKTFIRVLLPLSWRSILAGFVMSTARGISEFGAVVIIAYHPKIAPVLIFERFENFGLKHSQPVSVLLVMVTLILFLALRMLTVRNRNAAT